jgi:uncharacterized protein with FMN-binding domain
MAKGAGASHATVSVGAGSSSTSAPTSTSTSTSTSASTSHGSISSTRPPGSATTSPPSVTTQKVSGAAESFPYGTIQVELVLTGRRISDVLVLQAPQDGYSAQVAQNALPVLRNEVLAAQSAHIDTVSGASYDSQAYASSVQAALDKAHI